MSNKASKKRTKKLGIIGLMIVILLAVVLPCTSVVAETEAKTVDVMFLHDIHSHLNEFATVEDGQSVYDAEG